MARLAHSCAPTAVNVYTSVSTGLTVLVKSSNMVALCSLCRAAIKGPRSSLVTICVVDVGEVWGGKGMYACHV